MRSINLAVTMKQYKLTKKPFLLVIINPLSCMPKKEEHSFNLNDIRKPSMHMIRQLNYLVNWIEMLMFTDQKVKYYV